MYSIFTGWNVMRFLRLAIGVMAIVQAYNEGSWPLAAAGLFVMILAIANLGCCGSGGCVTGKSYERSNNLNKAEEITYEELGK